MGEFKDAQGRWITRGLILELNDYQDKYALFTLDDQPKERDGRFLEPIKQMYISCGDATEYRFACTYLGGWDHWQAMLKSPPVLAEVEKWRLELEVKLRSEAFFEIVTKSKSEKGYQAAKLILDKGWDVRKAGAPSKVEREGALKADRLFEQSVAEDAARLGLRRVK